MSRVVQIRTVFGWGAAIALTVVCTSIIMQAWGADAAPGPSESTVVMIEPRRVLDTRDPVDVGLAGPFVSPVAQKLQITGSIATTSGAAVVVPAGATGVLLNVTAVNTRANGFISIRPGNATGAPTTSSLNITAGVTVPNAVTVALPTTGSNAGRIDITFDALGSAGPTTDILIDVVGYATSTGLQELLVGQVTVAGSNMVVTGTNTGVGTANGCFVNLTGRTGVLPLDIPVGATILNVTGVFYDGTGPPYAARLRRVFTTASGDSTEVLQTATGGELTIETASKDLTPPVPQVADPGERFEVDFDDGEGSFGNGLCYVSVRYRLGGNPLPLVAATLSDAGTIECAPGDDACRVEVP